MLWAWRGLIMPLRQAASVPVERGPENGHDSWPESAHDFGASFWPHIWKRYLTAAISCQIGGQILATNPGRFWVA